MNKHLFSVAMALLLVAASNLSAHDFWLAATPPTEAGVTTINGHVGEKFPVPDGKTTPDRVDSWRVVTASGDMALGRDFFQDGQSLATRVTLAAPATYVGMMTILPREAEMKGKEFTDYLREEGLDQVIAERARLNQTDQPARERYARYAKIVLHTGKGDDAHVTRPANLAAEFVPSVNPASLSPGNTLSIQLLVQGRPVAGAQIAAVSRETRLDARTDAEGR